MKDYVLELVSKQTGYNAKLNIMREYLQAYALRILHDQGIFRTTAFLGGTALRFLYDMPRFSEDLDFSAAGKKGDDFSSLIKKLKDDLVSAGYNVTATHKKEKTVLSSFIRFEGLMYETRISPHKNQKFSIKLEIDTNPPAGAALKTVVVNKYFPIAFLSYDLASLFAGKIHALLSRKYTKGRDFFDLGWYLSKWKDLVPNLTLLENALKQTGWKGEIPTRDNWRDLLYKTVKDKDWKKIKQDVESFLENPADLNILTQENVLNLLRP
ncbi:MAG: nucleotidyl transferase AbiEii/AbiGii toxin family protein [Candidatus Omnitrophica bacterium]|nr:nucleotidyl transferase AbiEii/AbiGii toxin family protein [Candidatus Omnitrophota bacterium]